MPRLQASISLPYVLRLTRGLYPSGQPGQELEVHQRSQRPVLQPASELVSPTSDRPDSDIWEMTVSHTYATVVSFTLAHPGTEDPDEQRRLKSRQADQLLNLTNRLLRGYRSITKNTAITELSRAGASPFRFRADTDRANLSAWESELTYQADLPKKLPKRALTITRRVRDLFASGTEPEVADLFLLDAERALHEGRFREAVLFCWSTIDSTFSRKYDDLVDSKLEGEWAEARDFFKGVDFGLRKKMSAALYLVSGRSLFRESGDLWQRLSSSYNKRNGIIHRGESANEDDARRAVDVARRIVEIMSAL